MIKYVIDRLLQAIPVIVGISLVTFALMRWLPGDPVFGLLFEGGGDMAAAEALREQMGFNDPALVQFGRFLAGAARGDLGVSLYTRRPVLTEIATYLPNTLELTAAALVLAAFFGIVMGVLAAVYRNRWVDQVVMLLSLIGVSMPIFWLGLLLILVFGVGLGWLPVMSSGAGIKGLIMPAVCLAFSPAAFTARLTRGSLLEILPQDYIRTAHAKGLAASKVLLGHAMRNALIPIVTIVGLQAGNMLSGVVITETVFTRPGIGTLIIDGIRHRDYFMVQGAVLYTSVLYVMINLIVDISYGFIDPRVRHNEA